MILNVVEDEKRLVSKIWIYHEVLLRATEVGYACDWKILSWIILVSLKTQVKRLRKDLTPRKSYIGI